MSDQGDIGTIVGSSGDPAVNRDTFGTDLKDIEDRLELLIAEVTAARGSESTLQDALDAKQGTDQRNENSGYAGLNSSGNVPADRLPDSTEFTSNKNQANGYAGLDSNGDIDESVLPSSVTGLQAQIDAKQGLAQKGQASGYAGLGADAKVPLAQLPDVVSSLVTTNLGAWNASTNTPTIPAASSSNNGSYYVVTVAGSTDIDGETNWQIGDMLISNGTAWERVPFSKVDGIYATTDNIKNLTTDDVSAGDVLTRIRYATGHPILPVRLSVLAGGLSSQTLTTERQGIYFENTAQTLTFEVITFLGVLDARHAGAIADGGTTDSQPAVQACVDYLEERAGGTVVLPAEDNHYRFESQGVTLYRSVAVEGSAPASDSYRSDSALTQTVEGLADAGGGSTTVTITGHGLTNGQQVHIKINPDLKGDYLISNVTANTFDVSSSFSQTAVTSYADAGGGQVTVTAAGHGLSDGDRIEITDNADYNGAYVISNVTTNTFEITATFASSSGGSFHLLGKVNSARDPYTVRTNHGTVIDTGTGFSGFMFEAAGQGDKGIRLKWLTLDLSNADATVYNVTSITHFGGKVTAYNHDGATAFSDNDFVMITGFTDREYNRIVRADNPTSGVLTIEDDVNYTAGIGSDTPLIGKVVGGVYDKSWAFEPDGVHVWNGKTRACVGFWVASNDPDQHLGTTTAVTEYRQIRAGGNGYYEFRMTGIYVEKRSHFNVSIGWFNNCWNGAHFNRVGGNNTFYDVAIDINKDDPTDGDDGVVMTGGGHLEIWKGEYQSNYNAINGAATIWGNHTIIGALTDGVVVHESPTSVQGYRIEYGDSGDQILFQNASPQVEITSTIANSAFRLSATAGSGDTHLFALEFANDSATPGEVNAQIVGMTGNDRRDGAIVVQTGRTGSLSDVIEFDEDQIISILGNELTLDADKDTSIRADTDDEIVIKIGNTDRHKLTTTQIGLFTDDPNADIEVRSASAGLTTRLSADTGVTDSDLHTLDFVNYDADAAGEVLARIVGATDDTRRRGKLEFWTTSTTNTPALSLTIDRQGRFIAPRMPTSDPGVSGMLWSDSGTIKISA